MAIGGAAYLAVALFCTQVPLLQSLGYESALVLALAATAVALLTTISAVRDADPGGTVPPRDRLDAVLNAFLRSLRLNLALLLIPLAVSGLAMFVVPPCDWLEGLGFYALIPGVTVVISSALGLFCSVHYRRPRSMAALCVAATIAYAAGLGYWTPAIFSYNPFYGYFPGVTYDETVGLGVSLVAARALTLALAGILVWLSTLIALHCPADEPGWKTGVRLLDVLLRPAYRWITAGILIGVGFVIAFRCELGLESTASHIRSRLGGEHRTANFTIYYPRESVSPDRIARIGEDHEFALAMVVRAFALTRTAPIESYLYPSEDGKRRLMGAGDTEIAKPWSRQIHVTLQSLHEVLRHEIVHVVAGDFGPPVIRASLSTGLVEGLAVAVDWNWGNRTPHQYAAALRAAGLAPDITALMTFRGFASQAPAVSYVLAGSFTRYLVDRFGMRKLAQVYRHNDYEREYGRSLDELVVDWQRFLDGVDPGPQPQENVDALFRRPPLFARVCPRQVGRWNAEARQALSGREYARALELYTRALSRSGSFASLAGVLAARSRLGEHAVVSDMVDSLRASTGHPGTYLPLALMAADALWALGNRDSALSVLEAIISADWSEAHADAARIRRAILTDTAAPAEGILRFVLSDAPDSDRVAILDSLPVYARAHPAVALLRSRALLRSGRPREALEAVSSVSFPARDPLEGMRLQAQGRALMETGQPGKAKAAFWQSLNSIDRRSAAAMNRIADWIDRAEWTLHRPGAAR
jgi:tetratricopeptide (TPR) repeat protein